MLRNRLSEILTAKKIKAIQVSNDTGIARSTLSRIINNTSEKIEYSTIDTLCMYLKITPQEFFEYKPIKINLAIDDLRGYHDFNSDDTYQITSFVMQFSFDFLIQVIGKDIHNFHFSGRSLLQDNMPLNAILSLDDTDKKESFKRLLSSIGTFFEEEIIFKIDEMILSAHIDFINSIEFKHEDLYGLIIDKIKDFSFNFDWDLPPEF